MTFPIHLTYSYKLLCTFPHWGCILSYLTMPLDWTLFELLPLFWLITNDIVYTFYLYLFMYMQIFFLVDYQEVKLYTAGCLITTNSARMPSKKSTQKV